MLKINIPEEPNWIITKLIESGFDAYVVGGCVRDSILGNIPKDWDICTNALPQDVKNVFKEIRIVDTGLKHGTVTIILNNIGFEVTTYRIDGEYSDCRRPNDVYFTNNLIDDLSRRDFTINSMAYNNNVGLIDCFGGELDLQNRLLRCVGKASDRFNEDALRILRALRFSSVLRLTIEEETAKAICYNFKLLSKISVERISSEMNKLLCGLNCSIILKEYQDVISFIIPEIKPMIGFSQNNPYHVYDVWEHTLVALNSSPQDLEVRLAVLFHDISKPATYSCVDGVGHFYKHHLYSEEITRNILKRMKYDNKTIDNVCLLVYNHDVEITNTPKSVKRSLNKVGDLFEKLLDVKYADMYGQSKKAVDEKKDILDGIKLIYQEVLNQSMCFNLKDMDINGKDLLLNGFKEGKQIGSMLNKLLELVIDGIVENNKDDLLMAAKLL